MKRMLIGIIFTLYSLFAYAPASNILYISQENPIKKVINGYETLIAAIYYHEAGFNPYAYNPRENAVGGLQIRQCRLDSYNKLTGKKYTLEEMYDFNKAKEVFLYFAEGKSYEQAAKNWNGSGPMTEKYWDSINYILQKGYVRIPKQMVKEEIKEEKPIERVALNKVSIEHIPVKINV